jgi:hypothetical protein
METDTKIQKEGLGGHPPKKTAVRNLLKVANGLVSVRYESRGEALAP